VTSPKLLPEQTFPYLTVIPDRRPVQKVHRNIGQAKNAVSYRDSFYTGIPCDIQVYEWKRDHWTLLWDIPAGTKSSQMPWKIKEQDNA